MNVMLFLYSFLWMVYFLVQVIIPAESIYKETHLKGIAISLLYIVLSIASAWLLGFFFHKNEAVSGGFRIHSLYDTLKPARLIVLTGFLISVGLILHFYDKVIIMQIDYSRGLGYAREAWKDNYAIRGGGISSWQSVIGHILTNFYFIPILVIILFWEEIPRLYKYFGLFVSFSALFFYSASIGSRSVPLVLLAFGVSVLLARKPIGKKIILGKLMYLVSLLLVVVFIGYALFVFNERANYEGNESKIYVSNFFSELRGKPTSGYDYGDKLPGPLSNLYYNGILAGMYITHNQWTFDYILTLDERPGDGLLGMVFSGLSRFGLIDKNPYSMRAFQGRFLSLPGAVFYNFGLPGVIIISLLHGALIFIANISLRQKAIKLWHIYLYIIVACFSIISPLTSVANLMSFPYLVFSMLCIPLLMSIAALLPAPQTRATPWELSTKEKR